MHYYLGETPETPLSHWLWGRAQHRQPLLSQHGCGARRGCQSTDTAGWCHSCTKRHGCPGPCASPCHQSQLSMAGKGGKDFYSHFVTVRWAGTRIHAHNQAYSMIRGFFSDLFPLPNATTYLVCHMESIRRGECSLQALASCHFEASQTTSLTLRTEPCSLPQRQAVTGPGTRPGFPEPQPSREASSAARPASAGGGKGGWVTARR